jgi:DNA-binding PucR family transcriptional regulator
MTLEDRLSARRGEIAKTVLTRVRAVGPPEQGDDPDYAEGLRAAVHAAVDYAVASVVSEEEPVQEVPAILLEQARAAASREIGLDVVLRRYLVGYSLLSNCVIEEAAGSELSEEVALRRSLWAQARLFDRLLAAISEEYGTARRSRSRTALQRRIERVERILAGEPLEFLDVDYQLDDWHVGLIGEGAGGGEAARRLARVLERRSIVVERPEGTFWAWLGGRDRLAPEALERSLGDQWPARTPLAIGEPAAGRAGWRMTHQQAQAAMPIARRRQPSFVRYRDVALLSSVSRDDLLTASLRDIYLAPLEEEGEKKAALVDTLRAYFGAERNVSSAAAALGVNRRTVANRLRNIEERLGCSLLTNAAEIEAALGLDELTARPK